METRPEVPEVLQVGVLTCCLSYFFLLCALSKKDVKSFMPPEVLSSGNGTCCALSMSHARSKPRVCALFVACDVLGVLEFSRLAIVTGGQDSLLQPRKV